MPRRGLDIRAVVVAVAAGFGTLGASGTTAIAAETLAAECQPARVGYFQNGGANDRFAMTFSSGQTGPLTRAEIDFQEPIGHQMNPTVQLVAVDQGTGVPTDTVLAATTAPDPTTTGPTTLAATFATPAHVTAGETYALALSRPSAGVDAIRWGYNSDPGSCSGRFFFQPGGAGPWNASINFDMIFRVFVEVPAAATPETTITNAPPKKIRKRRAIFEFTGADARVVTGFTCSVDGGPFAPCTSPHTVRVRRGRHTFQVQAVDDAGAVDGTPATADWKRKRKKRS